MAATADSTTGHRLADTSAKQDRLFVALADAPFSWFSSGKKRWELRRFRGQYTRKHVRVGRRVELRRGYRGPDVLWGQILDVVEANNIEEFFEKVPFEEVIPVARSLNEAVTMTKKILKADANTHLLGFAIRQL